MYRILILVVFSNLCSFCLYCILCNIIAIVSTCNFCLVLYFFLSTSHCFLCCKLILFGKYCSHCTVSIVSIVTFVNKCCVLKKKKKLDFEFYFFDSVCFRLPITKKKAVKFSNSIFSLLFVSLFDF